MIPVRQSTAFEIAIGPVLDADGVAVTGCIVGDFKLKKTTGNFAALNGSATLTHVSAGVYDLVLTTSDTDTVGLCTIAIDDTTNACASLYLQVIEEAVYDRDYAASATGNTASVVTIASDLVQVYSDTTIATSKTTQIYSDTTVIASDAARIESKAVQIYSDTTIIYSDTTLISSDAARVESKAVQIYSDTTAIHTQTTTASSKAVQIYSDTTIVVSDTTHIDSDTTRIESKAVQIYSDTTAIHTQTTTAASKAVQIYSDTTIIYSDTTLISSDVARCESKAVQIYSDTTIVTSKTTQIYSDTTLIASDVARCESKAVQIYSDTTIIASDGPNTPTKGVQFDNLMFMLVDATDLNTPETGATVTATISKDGAAFGACANSVSEVSGGYYKITLSSTETNADIVALKFTASGCAQRNIVFRTQPT